MCDFRDSLSIHRHADRELTLLAQRRRREFRCAAPSPAASVRQARTGGTIGRERGSAPRASVVERRTTDGPDTDGPDPEGLGPGRAGLPAARALAPGAPVTRGRVYQRDGPAGRVVRGVPGVPGRHHRQRRVPLASRRRSPDTSISGLSWVLNAYNIVFAAFLIPCGRLTDLLGRRRAFVGGVVGVHRRLRPLRGGTVAGLPGRRAGAAGPRRRAAGPGLAGAGGRMRSPRSTVRTPSASGARLQPWPSGPGPADRRPPGRAGRVALGVPDQHPVRDRRGLGRPARTGREPGARASRAPRPRRGGPVRPRPRPSPSASSRATTGAGPAGRSSGPSSPRPCCWSCSCVSSRAPPHAAARPGLLRLRALRDRQPRHGRCRAWASTPTC